MLNDAAEGSMLPYPVRTYKLSISLNTLYAVRVSSG